jgi:hypothetical protein
MHLLGDPTEEYFTRSKMMNDFSPLFDDCKHTQDALAKAPPQVAAQMRQRIKGYFDKDKFKR